MLAASIINLFAVRYALKTPRKPQHRFGHEQAEALARAGPVRLYILARLLLYCCKAIDRLLNPRAADSALAGRPR